METDKVHIRHLVLFFFDGGKNATEAARSICEVYGEVISVRSCQEWYQKFRNGDRSLEDRPRSGRPVTLDNDLLLDHLKQDPRQTTQELAEKLNVGKTTVFEHLISMGKIFKHGIWVPHQLSINNKLQ